MSSACSSSFASNSSIIRRVVGSSDPIQRTISPYVAIAIRSAIRSSWTLIAHATAVAARNAKALDVGYGPAKRAREAVEVAHHYRHELARARSWLAAHVLPAMRAAALADPPRWQ